MFLISPWAWGDARGLGTFVANMHRACESSYKDKFAQWSGISPANRERLASALCEDDRIFWPFAQAQSPEMAPHLEDRYRNRENFLPLTFGLMGGSPRETSEILHALRWMLTPSSLEILRWNGDRERIKKWLGKFDGGMISGVVEVEASRQNLDLAQDALSFMRAFHLDSHVLTIVARHEIKALLPSRGGDTIHWVQLEDCTNKLTRY